MKYQTSPAIAFREIIGVSLDFPNWLANNHSAKKEAKTTST
jgi:hypothetical protein